MESQGNLPSAEQASLDAVLTGLPEDEVLTNTQALDVGLETNGSEETAERQPSTLYDMLDEYRDPEMPEARRKGIVATGRKRIEQFFLGFIFRVYRKTCLWTVCG